jgi:hypothetical protein
MTMKQSPINNHGLTEDQVADLKEAFAMFDINGDGEWQTEMSTQGDQDGPSPVNDGVNGLSWPAQPAEYCKETHLQAPGLSATSLRAPQPLSRQPARVQSQDSLLRRQISGPGCGVTKTVML